MRVAVLGSGSSGNAVVVASGRRRLLIDAGFSCRELERRLALLGEEAARLDAILLTHEHGDHVRGAARLALRYGVPVYATAGTLSAAGLVAETLPFDGKPFPTARTVRSGTPFGIPRREDDGSPCASAFEVEAFGVPHDAAEPVGYVIEDGEGARVGLACDLGCRSQLAWGRLTDLDCLILESNHDLQMLRSGPYPWHLKQRVAGRHGHLSNREAADGLVDLLSDRLRALVLYHLSRTNNLPALALEAVSETIDRAGADTDVVISRQDRPTPWIEVS